MADVDSANVDTLLADASLVMDGSDNFEIRYVLNDACIKQVTPWIYSGAVGSQGMTMTVRPGESACFRCVFPDPPRGAAATCDTAGVLGPAIRMIGALAAAEAIKLLVGDTGALNPGLIHPDAWHLTFQTVRVARRIDHPWMVDAAQTAGVYPIDAEDMGIDLLAFPGHKGLFGPPGTGGLIVGDGIVLESWREGGTGSQSESDRQPEFMPDRLEAGTLTSVGLAGPGAGLRFVEEAGRPHIEEHEQALFSQLLRGLAQIPGVALYGPPTGSHRASVVSFNLDGWDPQDAAAVLDVSFNLQCRAPRSINWLQFGPSLRRRFATGAEIPIQPETSGPIIALSGLVLRELARLWLRRRHHSPWASEGRDLRDHHAYWRL